MKSSRVQDKQLAVGVEFVVDFLEVRDVHMGVDLGGGDVHVAEHLLNAAQIGSAG